MFSTITTDESTNIPIAMTKPPRLIKFADKLNCFIRIKVINAAIGNDNETTIDDLISPRKIASSTITRITACPSAPVIVFMAVLIKLDLS